MNAPAPPPFVRDTSPGLYVSPEMVTELAMGLDPELAIAAKYGLDAVAYQALSGLEWFQAAVYRRRQELADEGVTFAIKAAMVSEELMMEGYKLAKAGSMKPNEITDLLKVTSSLAGMQPKHTQAQAGGAAFQIVINVPDQVSAPGARPPPEMAGSIQKELAAPLVIDMKAVTVTQDPATGEKTVSGFTPPGFSMRPAPPPAPGLGLNSDLTGPPLKDTP